MSEQQAIEALREIWTPDREVVEVSADLAPQTVLDSDIRKILHLICQQGGSQRIDIGSEDFPVVPKGTLRWETVHGPGARNQPRLRRRELTIWVIE